MSSIKRELICVSQLNDHRGRQIHAQGRIGALLLLL